MKERRNDKKIDDLTKKIDEYISADLAWKKVDQEWKQNAQPAIDAFNNLTGGGKLVVASLAGIAIVITSVYTIKTFFLKL